MIYDIFTIRDMMFVALYEVYVGDIPRKFTTSS